MEIKVSFLTVVAFILFSCEKRKEEIAPLKLDITYGTCTPSFIDTVIFHPTEVYTYENYKGLKPFFIRIWFPDQRDDSTEKMTIGDLFDFNIKDENLIVIRDSLKTTYQKYLGYSVVQTIGPDDSTLTSHKLSLLKEVMRMTVFSQLNFGKLPKGKFPVVLYHHGYGGWSHDNFLFAEYMASHGFVVVASNYEWPEYDGGFEEGNKDIEIIQAFVKTLSFVDSTRVFAVGHSWGAQSFLYYDNHPRHPFSTTISLHTTMEHWPALDSIRKYYKSMSRVLLDSSRKTSPTFIFAPEKPSNNFLIFRKSKSADYSYINVRNPISHDGFISLDNLRYFMRSKYNPKEDSLLQLQFLTYQQICEAIRQQLTANKIEWRSHHSLLLIK